VGQVHHAHAATAELPLDAEWTYLFARRRTVKTSGGKVFFLIRPLIIFCFGVAH
jgi:hypothetical protein